MLTILSYFSLTIFNSNFCPLWYPKILDTSVACYTRHPLISFMISPSFKPATCAGLSLFIFMMNAPPCSDVFSDIPAYALLISCWPDTNYLWIAARE